MVLGAVVLLTFSCTGSVVSVAPIAGAVAAGAISGLAYISNKLIGCQFYECCEAPWIELDVTKLQREMKSKVFGQALIMNTVVRAVVNHLRNPNPHKPLVLSFHGLQGTGKSHVADVIAGSMFKKGLNSSYYHKIVASLLFKLEGSIMEYRNELQKIIRQHTQDCGKSLFVIDEFDKMPNGLADSMKPFLDYHDKIDGIDFRRTTFIFLSNSGGRDISELAHQTYVHGRRREDIALGEVETILTNRLYNDKSNGGLWHSWLIEHSLIDFFIPFLPLERSHVQSCIRAAAVQVTKQVVACLDKVEPLIKYQPDDLRLFSEFGCKPVSTLVLTFCSDIEEVPVH